MYKRPIYQYTWNQNMSALMSTDGVLKNMCSHGTKVEPNVIWQLIPTYWHPTKHFNVSVAFCKNVEL